MSDAAEQVPLVYSHGKRLAPGAPVSAVMWLGDEAAYTLGDGSVRFAGLAGERARIDAHKGAILSAALHPDGDALVSGGDDGRVLRIGVDGAVLELGAFGRDWVGGIAASARSKLIVAATGAVATVWLSGTTRPSHSYAFPSTVGGVALDAKGLRLAVSHYGGAALLYPKSAQSSRFALKWAGSHLACTLSPDCGYLVTATQELGLHGWRLPIGADMAMSGYRAKTRSFSWDRRARWLATSGDARVILWPFDGKTGPMGRKPHLTGARGALVTMVAFHPTQDILAVGYADGAVVLARIDDDNFVLVDQAGGAGVSALGWNAAGTMLAWGDEDGGAGLLDMTVRA
jgi:WD40 repeat protein